jgi:hypothetical protein
LLIDGKRVGGMGCIVADREELNLSDQLQVEGGRTPQEALDMAARQLAAQGRHNQFEFYAAIREFLQMSIADALGSPDALHRSLAYLDARLGKRRLGQLASVRPATDMEVACLRTRLEAEGIAFSWRDQ